MLGQRWSRVRLSDVISDRGKRVQESSTLSPAIFRAADVSVTIPEPTCPLIDEAKTKLTSIRTSENAETVDSIMDDMEQLRYDNANLRMGVFHYRELFESVAGHQTGL